MKQELESKDICGYLPYKLNVLFENCDMAAIESIGFPDGGIQLCEKGDWRRYHLMSKIKKEADRCKIILRPISDLYKEITNNGSEPFIPIVELAMVAFPKTKAESWTVINNNSDITFGCHYGGFAFFVVKDGFIALGANDTSIQQAVPNQY